MQPNTRFSLSDIDLLLDEWFIGLCSGLTLYKRYMPDCRKLTYGIF